MKKLVKICSIILSIVLVVLVSSCELGDLDIGNLMKELSIDTGLIEEIEDDRTTSIDDPRSETKQYEYDIEGHWVKGKSSSTKEAHEYETVESKTTCTSDGFKINTCKICGYSYKEDGEKATGHNYVNGKCIYCNKQAVILNDDTYHWYEGDKGHQELHNFSEEKVRPTCTKDGYTIHKCDICGYKYTDNIIKAAGHNMEDGKCTICGYDETIATCEHNYEYHIDYFDQNTCGGFIEYLECLDCGATIIFDNDLKCNFETQDEIEVCSKCGCKYLESYEDIESDNECLSISLINLTLVDKDDNQIYQHTFTDIYENHNWQYLSENSNYIDGTLVYGKTYECKICGSHYASYEGGSYRQQITSDAEDNHILTTTTNLDQDYYIYKDEYAKSGQNMWIRFDYTTYKDQCLQKIITTSSLFEESLERSAEYHDYSIEKHELVNGEGSSCEDGLKIYYICSRCGNISNNYSLTHDHYVYDTEEITLRELGYNCDGFIRTSRCTCGEVEDTSLQHYYGMENIDTKEENLADGGRRTTYTYECKNCGLITYKIKELHTTGCEVIESNYSLVIINGKSYKYDSYENSYYNHDYVNTIESNYDQDGNLIQTETNICKYCHSYIIDETICDANKIKIQYHHIKNENTSNYHYELIEKYAVIGGIDVTIYSYQNENDEYICETSYVFDTENCVVNATRTETNYGETRTYDFTEEFHSYVIQHTLKEGATNCNEGVITCEKCQWCGKEINTRTIYHHENDLVLDLDLADFGYCGNSHLRKYECPCGEDHYTDFYLDDCIMRSKFDEETLEDGTIKRTYTYTCKNCGLTYYTISETKVENCLATTSEYQLIILDDVEYRFNESKWTSNSHSCTPTSNVTYEGDLRVETHSETCQNCGYKITVISKFNHLNQIVYQSSETIDERNDIYDLYVNEFTHIDAQEFPTREYHKSGSSSYEYKYTYDTTKCLRHAEYYYYENDKLIHSDTKDEEYHYHQQLRVLKEGSETCPDGLTVYDICVWCQKVFNKYDSYSHDQLYTRVDLSVFGVCDGGYLEIYTCACGENNQYYRNLNCSLTENSSTYVDESGITHTLRTRTCSKCGLVFTDDYYDVIDEETCQTIRYYKYDVYKDDISVHNIEYHRHIGINHVYYQSPSTTENIDGILTTTTIQTCSRCGATITNIHEETDNWYRDTNIENDEKNNNNYLNKYEYNLINGQYQNTLHYYESNNWYEKYVYEYDEENCTKTTIYTNSSYNESINVEPWHNSYTRHYELAPNSTSCDDGYITYLICDRCGERFNEWTRYGHTMWSHRIDLSQYGETDGSYIEETECVCGENYNYYIFFYDYISEQTNVIDDEGVSHTIIKNYKDHNDIVWIKDVYNILLDPCKYEFHQIDKVYNGDELIFEGSSININVQHHYQYQDPIITNNPDGTKIITRKNICECGSSVEIIDCYDENEHLIYNTEENIDLINDSYFHSYSTYITHNNNQYLENQKYGYINNGDYEHEIIRTYDFENNKLHQIEKYNGVIINEYDGIIY